MELALIAAIGRNRELGAGNELLWHLPKDFSWFIKHTKNKPVIMGRKTMESLGKPLKNRLNIVLTRSSEVMEGFVKVGKWDEAFAVANDWLQERGSVEFNTAADGYSVNANEIMIIGGGDIYRQAIERVNRMYITEVEAEFSTADTYFPVISDQWKQIYSESISADEKHAVDFRFIVYERGSNF
jgi:dihydrofolate reductase